VPPVGSLTERRQADRPSGAGRCGQRLPASTTGQEATKRGAPPRRRRRNRRADGSEARLGGTEGERRQTPARGRAVPQRRGGPPRRPLGPAFGTGGRRRSSRQRGPPGVGVAARPRGVKERARASRDGRRRRGRAAPLNWAKPEVWRGWRGDRARQGGH
jgi:hypothetical protein